MGRAGPLGEGRPGVGRGGTTVVWMVRWRGVEERFADRGEALERFDLLDALGREPELVEVAAGVG